MSNIKLFESQKIRSHRDAEKEKWYFAIVDIIAVLTESTSPQVYWRVLKKRLTDEGNQTVTNCNALTGVCYPFDKSKEAAKEGGTIAGNTRKAIEAKTGKKIVSSQNAKGLKATKNKNN